MLVFIKEVLANGSCFYNSISAQTNINSSYLRDSVANFLQNVALDPKHKFMSQLVFYADDQKLSIPKYIEKTRKCLWAGPFETEILSLLLERRIQIYNMKDLEKYSISDCIYDLKHISPIVDFGDKRKRPLMVVIHGYKPKKGKHGYHYDALIPIKLFTKLH